MVVCGFLALVNCLLVLIACFLLLLILTLMLKLLFPMLLVLSVVYMGCIFSYRLLVPKLLVVIQQIMLTCGEQAYACAGDFTKGFLPLPLIKRAEGDPRWGLEALQATEMVTLWQLQTR